MAKKDLKNLNHTGSSTTTEVQWTMSSREAKREGMDSHTAFWRCGIEVGYSQGLRGMDRFQQWNWQAWRFSRQWASSWIRSRNDRSLVSSFNYRGRGKKDCYVSEKEDPKNESSCMFVYGDKWIQCSKDYYSTLACVLKWWTLLNFHVIIKKEE